MPFIDSTFSSPAPAPAPSRAAARPLRRAGRDLAYVLAVVPLSTIALGLWVTGLSVVLSLAVLIVGALAWLGTVALARVTTGWDRRLVGWYTGRPIVARYRPTTTGEPVATVKTVTRDPQTWRDLRWTMINSTLGLVMSTAAVTFTGIVLGYLTTPAWWWAIPHPSQQYATLNLGIYTVTSTGLALATTALGLALLPLAAGVNRWVATRHARLAASTLAR